MADTAEDVTAKIRALPFKLGDPEFAEAVFRIIGDAEIRDKSERMKIWKQVQATQQNPVIGRDELREVIRATTEAISTLRAKTKWTSRSFDPSGAEIVRTETHEFVLKGDSVFLKTTLADGSTVTNSSNGTEIKSLHLGPGKSRAGSISEPGGRNPNPSFFWKLDSNPLSLAMLVDGKSTLGEPSPWYDIVEFMEMPGSTLVDGLRDFKGTKCLLITDLQHEAYLDPERNFAVLEMVVFTIRDARRREILRRSMLDLTDYGNSLWIPKRATELRHNQETGKLEQTDEIEVLEFQVNETLPEDFFDAIFPEDIVVADGIRKITYHTGPKGSIATLVSDASGPPLPPRTSRSTFWLMTINIGVVILIVGFTLIRRLKTQRK